MSGRITARPGAGWEVILHMEIPAALLLYAVVGILAVILVVWLFRKPLKWIFKLLLNALIGYVALMLLNYFGGNFGISLPVNWFNAIVVGVLGLPGVILLLLMKYLL